MEGDLEVDLDGEMEGTPKGTSDRTWKGTCQAQVRSDPGYVWSRSCLGSSFRA